jgi:3-dehydroquinate synthase
LPEVETDRILSVIQQLGFELFAPIREVPGDSGRQEMLEGLEEFREHLGGRLSIPMITAPGDRLEIHEVDGAIVKLAVEELEQRFG